MNLNNRQNILNGQRVYFLLLVAGIICSFVLYPLSVDYPYQFGKQMIGLFIPPFLTGLYLFYFVWLNQLNSAVFVTAVSLFLLQLIPFYPLFFKETAPYPGEDLARNMIYAKNMIANHTLWGGDELVFEVHSKSYITQPGYRYFVAFELLLFKKLYRFVSIFNLLMFITALYAYYKVIAVTIVDRKIKVLLAFISLLTIPYATKNILMGLSEWLTVLLFVFLLYTYLIKRNTAVALLLLALVVFFRQNLAPPVLLFALIIILSEKKKLRNSILFVLVLLLPVYHNLYYEGEFRFFISIFNYPFLTYANNNLPPNGVNYWLLMNNALHYVGIHLNRDGSVDFIEESFLFLLLFNYSIIKITARYFKGIKRVFLIVIFCSAFVPTLVLATDFYPRFEFVVVYIVLVSVPLLQVNQSIVQYLNSSFFQEKERIV